MQRFMKVSDGLFRGGAPSEDEVHLLKREFGVNRIVSLDGECASNIADVCDEIGVEHIVLPIEFKNIQTALKILDDNLVELLTENEPTFVHCLHGKDRTGLACALYRIRVQGWEPMDALNEAMNYGFGIGVSPKIRHMYCKMILTPRPDENESHSFAPNSEENMERDIGEASDCRSRRRQVRRILLQDMNDAMAHVGVYDGIENVMRNTVGLPAVDYAGSFPYGTGYIL